MTGLTALLNQYQKIFNSAQLSDNQEIYTQAVVHLNLLLLSFTRKSGQEAFVKEILRRIMYFADKTREHPDYTAYITHAEWYVEVVLDENISKEVFLTEYLSVFNTLFKRNLYKLIQEKKYDLFENIVRNIDQKLPSSSYWINNVRDYTDILSLEDLEKYHELVRQQNVHKITREVESIGRNINSEEDIKKFVQEFEKLKEYFYEPLSRKSKTKARKIEKRLLRGAYTQFFTVGVKYIYYVLASYSIFKDEPKFILNIWNALQPSDADAHHIGFEVYPTSLEELIELYIGKPNFDDSFETWDGNHGTSKYKRLYFLLLASKHIRGKITSIPTANTDTEQLEFVMQTVEERIADLGNLLPGAFNRDYRDMQFVLDQIESNIDEYRNRDDLANILGLKFSNYKKFVDTYLVGLIKKLKSDINQKLNLAVTDNPLSNYKINKFKTELLDEYDRVTLLSKLFDKHNLLVDVSDETYEGELRLFGLNKIQSREMFFDDWYVDYGSWSAHMGKGIANSEDDNLIQKLISKAETKSFDNIQKTIAEKKWKVDKTVLIVDHSYIYDRLLRTESSFVPKWQTDDAEDDKTSTYFEGYFKVMNEKIPVFVSPKRIEGALLVDFSNLGEMLYLSPFDEDTQSFEKLGHFSLQISDLSEDEDLRNKLISRNLSWLEREGGEQAQHEFLREKLILKIFERFEIDFKDSPNLVFFSEENK